MDTTTMTVILVTDLYVAGITEDGVDYTAECYTVSIEAQDGRRWLHNTTYFGADTITTDEGFTLFADKRTRAKLEAETLRKRVVAAGVVDLTHWTEAEPGYGSEAYCTKYGF